MLKKIFATSAVAVATAGVVLMAAPAQADDENETSGDGSVLGGNQVDLDANIPVNVCGNAIAVLGLSNANCNDSGAAVVED
ncbi:small secreted domain DUF320 [Murinocardiopsis flavida]|uniref:Small secreted domain DUF320 n=1 Tax=Murinocardiopsis flavida TaxID=645275 RepID=A0A2P8D0Z7_9ACTN|nr:chaplin family protein [Murinocardiopsis flavida]PSK90893.1 small secreted domain DUF320 [Murinocardiopsis flavida]